MATMTIQIVAGAQTYTFNKTVSAAHLTRFLAAYRTLLGQIQDGVDENGAPIMRDRTDAEVADGWAQGLFAGTRDNVLRVEQNSAAQTASAAITPITMT